MKFHLNVLRYTGVIDHSINFYIVVCIAVSSENSAKLRSYFSLVVKF